MEQIIFFAVAAIALASAFYFVFARNPLYSILSLVVTCCSIAAIYFLLNAQFLWIVQLIVHAGAIMILNLDIMMMLKPNKADESQQQNLSKFIGLLAAGKFLTGRL